MFHTDTQVKVSRFSLGRNTKNLLLNQYIYIGWQNLRLAARVIIHFLCSKFCASCELYITWVKCSPN